MEPGLNPFIIIVVTELVSEQATPDVVTVVILLK